MEENRYPIGEADFFKIFICVLKFKANLTGREIKYLILRFGSEMGHKQIAEFDGRKIQPSAVNRVFERAYRKIRERKNNEKIT